jgi:hypothetical protein
MPGVGSLEAARRPVSGPAGHKLHSHIIWMWFRFRIARGTQTFPIRFKFKETIEPLPPSPSASSSPFRSSAAGRASSVVKCTSDSQESRTSSYATDGR